ncbi:hypothetical protein M0R72_00805 [Candidatus Pacearchaeota archaeon]|jgi:hypothetical protein|nr:hypothetical protein [Candidatus Pacearchaeota archaeon]
MTKKNLLASILNLAFLVTMVGCGVDKPKVADIVVCHDSCNKALKACVDISAVTDKTMCFQTNNECMAACAKVTK